MALPSSPRVLITGIDSFTGYHLSQHLEQSGFSVFGTSLGGSENKAASENKNVYRCNISEPSQVLAALEYCKPDYLIHLAGISFVGHPVVSDFYNINVVGTQNILDTLLKCRVKPKKIILASSATVYGNQGIEVLDESICPQPANHYGISKLAMEFMARTYFDKLPIIITRPFNYVGVGQAPHFVIPKIVSHFKQKAKTLELGNLQVEREFNDVRFACEVYQRLLLCDSSSQVVNLCSGQGTSLLRVIDLMQEIAGYTIDVKVNPAFVRPNELPKLVGSTTKLTQLIGDIPRNGLAETLQSMYAND